MENDLSVAVELQRSGRYADAARLYHELLNREPDHPEALHLFGVMHHQCGHSDRAAQMITRAVSLRPGAAAFHSNLSEVLRSLGEYESAVESAREALRLQPDRAEAACNLGLALEAAGRMADAVDAFEVALRLRPSFALARNNLGTVLKKLGRDDEAFQAFLIAVEHEPTLAMAQTNLGQAMIDAGDLDHGLEHCQEAVRLQPDLAAAHNNLGNAYRALDRSREAYLAYSEAIRLSPGIAGARIHSNLGLNLQAEGESERAFACLRKAVELAPEDPEVWRHLAQAHAQDEDFVAAIPCCRRLVELAPERAQSHNYLGWALQQEGSLIEAAECYRRALEIRPDDIDVIMNRGSLFEELGEMAEAEACYRRVLSLKDTAGPLARLAILLRGRLPEEDREAIRAYLKADPADDPERPGLLFGLAQTCDALGEYHEAAACLKEANELSKSRRETRRRGYDSAEHSRFVDRLIEGFDSNWFDRLGDVGDDSCRPVFIVGMPRSGTTLVEQILASHPHVHGCGELRLARRMFDEIPDVAGRKRDLLSCLNSVDKQGVLELARRHLAGLDDALGRDRIDVAPNKIVDKMPDNYLYLGLVTVLFPRATFIHVRRDPRDVAFSCWMTNFRSIRWADDIDQIIARFNDHRRIMEHWRDNLVAPLHEVVYERLIDDFEVEAKRLIELCGLDWNPACREFYQSKRPVRTASVTQVRQPIYRRSVARWRHYEADLAPLFANLPLH